MKQVLITCESSVKYWGFMLNKLQQTAQIRLDKTQGKLKS